LKMPLNNRLTDADGAHKSWHNIFNAADYNPNSHQRPKAHGTVLRPAGCADRLRQSEKSGSAFPVQTGLTI
jgi:hypothetical protein